MERWIQMHYQIKEREKALEISKSRELFYWYGAFYNVSMVGLLYRFVVDCGPVRGNGFQFFIIVCDSFSFQI